MDEAVELAFKHERELRKNLEEDMEERIIKLEVSTNTQFKAIKADIKSMKTWDRFKMIGFIVVGLFLSSMPQYVPILQKLLK